MGSIAACTVGILFDLPAPIHILLCIAAAVAAGAVWGIIVGFLKVKRGINEVLSYIMFNWIAFYLSNYIVNLSAIHRTGGGEASKDMADSARHPCTGIYHEAYPLYRSQLGDRHCRCGGRSGMVCHQ